MTEVNDRIKRRVIALQDPGRKSQAVAMNVLSGMDGVESTGPVNRGIRVDYRLQHTCIKDLLAELHSKEVQVRRDVLTRLRVDLIRILEQNERDNLLSRDGWWQRVQAIHIADQARASASPEKTGNRRHWQHYLER